MGLFGGGGSDYAEQAAAELRQVKLPEIEEMRIELEQLVQQGILSPEDAQAALVEGSAYNGIQADPSLKANQLAALSSLKDISDSGGMTLSDQSALNKIQSEENSAARGQREAILQNANARGVGGSGLELAAQLQNQQDSATRASQRGTDVAAQAQARALQAIMQSGQLAGNIRSQDFDEQAKKAQAADQIAQFNAQNKQQVGMANASARNVAQAANLGEKQRVADTNLNMANQQQQYNKNLVQQDFENRFRRAGGTSQAIAGQAAQANADRAANQQMAGTALAAAAAFSDKNLKENVEDFNPSSFLDEITGYKYNYKDSKNGSGPQVGVMAQDLEKGAPQAVEDTPEGKMIDYNKMGGPILAALSDIHDRLKKVEGR